MVQKIEKKRAEKDMSMFCQNCGKGNLKYLMINMGDLKSIITCDTCDFEEKVRKND